MEYHDDISFDGGQSLSYDSISDYFSDSLTQGVT